MRSMTRRPPTHTPAARTCTESAAIASTPSVRACPAPVPALAATARPSTETAAIGQRSSRRRGPMNATTAGNGGESRPAIQTFPNVLVGHRGQQRPPECTAKPEPGRLRPLDPDPRQRIEHEQNPQRRREPTRAACVRVKPRRLRSEPGERRREADPQQDRREPHEPHDGEDDRETVRKKPPWASITLLNDPASGDALKASRPRTRTRRAPDGNRPRSPAMPP